MLFRQINLKDVSKPDYFTGKYQVSGEAIKENEIACEITNVKHSKDFPAIFDLLNSGKIKNYLCEKKTNGESDVFVLSSAIKLFSLTNESGNPPSIQELNKTIKNYLSYNNKYFNLYDKIFSVRKYLVMGILNATPDSFSDGGKFYDVNDAVAKGTELLNDGADIIDIGGESTRPGAKEVSLEEELKRVIPVIEELIKRKPEALLSIDTTKSAVAEAALNAGAKIINDISAFEFDEKILEIAAKFNAPYILMHMSGTPRTMQNAPEYSDVVSDIIEFLYEKSEIAKSRGVQNIIVDPGIGFGKSVEDNYEILRRLNEIKSLNYPILIGLSRKSFIGKSLNLEVENRDEPTTLLEALSVKNGASIIRTHNVKLANQTRNILSRL